MLSRRQFLARSAAAACALPTSRAFALKDAVGNALILPKAPQRIVAINPAMVESVLAIGAGDRLVAVGGKVLYPKEARELPSVGGSLGISVEAILAQKPDLVVIAVATEAAARLTLPLRELRIPVFLASYNDFGSILTYIRLLGEALDLREGAARVTAGMQATVRDVMARVHDRPRLGVYLETGAAGSAALQTVRVGHYADDAIQIAGGRNIFSIRGAPQVTLEGIAAGDPDVIVVLASNPGLTATAVRARPGWQALRAVREKNVVVLPRGYMLIPGPRQADAIAILARAIHPEAYAP